MPSATPTADSAARAGLLTSPSTASGHVSAARMRLTGQAVLPLRPTDRAFMLELGNGQRIRATCGTKLVALAEIADGALRPVRVLNH